MGVTLSREEAMQLYDRAVSRRQSPAPVDADGVEIRVGERLRLGSSDSIFVTVEGIVNDKLVAALHDNGSRGEYLGTIFRHSPPPEVKPSERVKTWTHQCQGQQAWMLDAGKDCERCGTTWEEALARCRYQLAEPSERAREERSDVVDAIAYALQGHAEAVSKRVFGEVRTVYLSDFEAAIRKHLLPLLPGRLRAITDVSHKHPNPMFQLWLLDGAHEVAHFQYNRAPYENECREWAEKVALALMAREARAALGEPPPGKRA
jgi:hypothetical protein